MNLITMGSEPDCDFPASGTRARLILINYNDIDRIYTNDEGRIISIGMLPDRFGYEFLGFKNDVKKSEEVVRREQSNRRFTHATGFIVYDVSQLQKNNLRGLVRGRFVAIVETKGQDVDSIEVLGKECGLEIVGGMIRNAHESGGFFVLNLATPDNGVEFERKLPQTLGANYDDAIDIIDSILTPSVEGGGGFEYEFDFEFEGGPSEGGFDYSLNVAL